MTRVIALCVSLCGVAVLVVTAQTPTPTRPPAGRGAAIPAPGLAQPSSIVEASIPDMQLAMEQGRVTSRQLVEQSLIRIATFEDRKSVV